MAGVSYIDNLSLSSAEAGQFKDLIKAPLNLLKDNSDRLLTVADATAIAEFEIAGLGLYRKAYSQDDLQNFANTAKKYVFIHSYKYDYTCYYDRDLSKYTNKENLIEPLTAEYVIKNGELFGFYYLMNEDGRGESSELFVEGVFLLGGDYYGFKSNSYYDTDSFSDPSYYEKEEKLSVCLSFYDDADNKGTPIPLNGSRIAMPPEEKAYIPLKKYRSGINDECLVSRMIADENKEIGAFFCMDKNLVSTPDSGWRFVSLKEPGGYLSKKENYKCCSLHEFAEKHPEIIPYLERDFYVCESSHFRAIYTLENNEWTAKRKL